MSHFPGTDRYGNPLLANASIGRYDHLHKQIIAAREIDRKVCSGLDATLAKAKDYCRERRYRDAAETLYDVLKKELKGIPAAEESRALFAKIDRYQEKRLKKIVGASATAPKKRASLRKLRTQTFRHLPVYTKIIDAYREADKAKA